MTTLLQDLRYGIRMLLKTPVVSGVAMLSLALGIAATASIFAILDGFLLEPLPYGEPEELVLFKKLDHAAIFLFIAGTSTAILGVLRVRWIRRLLVAVWGVALLALAVKMIVWPMPLWLTAVTYLFVGWTAAVGLYELATTAGWRQVRTLAAGALLYSLGAVIFALEWPVLWPGILEGHELFHLLVLGGSALHFLFIYRHCTRPGCFGAPAAEPADESAAEPALGELRLERSS